MQTIKLSLFKLNVPPDGLTSPPETVPTVAAVSTGINKIDLSQVAG